MCKHFTLLTQLASFQRQQENQGWESPWQNKKPAGRERKRERGKEDPVSDVNFLIRRIFSLRGRLHQGSERRGAQRWEGESKPGGSRNFALTDPPGKEQHIELG